MEYIEVLHQNYHMQGFTSGEGFMYWSFTDSVVKTTLSGTVKCQTEIKGGHLGDIDYHGGRLYASYLGCALPGHDWDDWTCFKIYVFDADDLKVVDIINMDICDRYKEIAGKEGDTRGFRGIDGVSVGTVGGEVKMLISCAILGESKYGSQIILQCTPEGKFEKEYHIGTGNTVFGIQNLDLDANGNGVWFSTYGREKPFQPSETLYLANLADCTVKEKYRFYTPYGFESCIDGFYASLQSGVNGNRNGYAYRCAKEDFRVFKTEPEIASMLGVK